MPKISAEKPLRPQASASSTPPKIAFSPSEVAELTSVGRTLLYTAMNSGALKSVKIGSRRLITLQAIQDWLGAHERRPATREAKRA